MNDLQKVLLILRTNVWPSQQMCPDLFRLHSSQRTRLLDSAPELSWGPREKNPPSDLRPVRYDRSAAPSAVHEMEQIQLFTAPSAEGLTSSEMRPPVDHLCCSHVLHPCSAHMFCSVEQCFQLKPDPLLSTFERSTISGHTATLVPVGESAAEVWEGEPVVWRLLVQIPWCYTTKCWERWSTTPSTLI